MGTEGIGLKASVFPVEQWARSHTPQDLLGCCEGGDPKRGPQKAVKAPWERSSFPRKNERALHYLFLFVKRAADSLYGNVSDFDVYAAINISMERIDWKANRPYRLC